MVSFDEAIGVDGLEVEKTGPQLPGTPRGHEAGPLNPTPVAGSERQLYPAPKTRVE